MAKTNKGLVSYAKAQIGKPYWWGTFGQKATTSLLTQKARQYPSMYPQHRINTATKNHLGKKVHDCVGLIKGYLWCDSNSDNTPRYIAAQDKSANGMYNACKERGYISTMPDIEGVLVFMDGHVGVYIGNGYVVEAKGFEYGVVKTKLAGRGWTRWGKCPYITYEKPATPKKKAPATASKAVKVGSKVKITGKYASSASSKAANHSRAIGNTAYITKIYSGKAFPYQLGTKKGSTESENTIGFAKASAFKIV